MSYWVKNKKIKADDFMLSEFLPGKEYAVQTLWHDGKLLHSQARERVEYFFGNMIPSGQSSTPSVAKTVKDQDVYDMANAAINSITGSPNGIYCVDMKRNSLGILIPTEVNYGRFFTTSDFFSSLGMNSPKLYCKMLQGYFPIKDDIKINCIEDEYYWLRGLDKLPTLIEGSEYNYFLRNEK